MPASRSSDLPKRHERKLHMKTLIVNAHPFPNDDAHFSQKLLKGFLAKYDAKFSRNDLDIVNLYEEDLPSIGKDLLTLWGAQMAGQALTEEQKALSARQMRYLDLFQAAKRVVFVSPLYNFNLPSRLKDFIDNVMVAGQTFKYTEKGPAGLLTDDHRGLLLSASGSVYTNNDQYTAFEFHYHYLKSVLCTIAGFSSFAAVRAQGVAILAADQVMASANLQLDAEFDKFYA
jgi:FMN-dependent NADH-azoreductase